MLRAKDAGWSPIAPHRLWLAVLAFSVLAPVAVAGPPKTKPAAPGRPPLVYSLAALDETGDVNGIIAFRVGELFAAPEMAGYAALLNEALATELKGMFGLPFNLPVKVQDIEQITARVVLKIEGKQEKKSSFMAGLVSVRMKKACNWGKIIKAELPQAKKITRKGVTYYEADWQPPMGPLGAFQICVADERTIVVDGAAIEKMIAARKKPLPRPAWAKEWKEVEGGLLAVVLTDPTHRYAAKCAKALLPPSATEEEKKHAELERTFVRTASRVVIGVDLRKGLHLRARFTCDKPEDAEELEQACQAFGKLLREGTEDQKELERHRRGQSHLVVGAGRTENQMKAMLESATIQRKGNEVIVTASSKMITLAKLRELFEGQVNELAAPAPK
jgi:hypothetical protein